jgi:hypothetical protein
VTPSGRLVVEEEIEHARSRELPVLVFLQRVGRDAQAEALAERLSDYVGGTLRKEFESASDLEDQVSAAVGALHLRQDRGDMDNARLFADLPLDHLGSQETALHVVFAPERQEEVIGPADLESDAFTRRLHEIAHCASVDLFSYAIPKTRAIDKSSIILLQGQLGDWRRAGQLARLEASESGRIAVSMTVTGSEVPESNLHFAEGLQLSAAAIRERLLRAFAFTAAFFDLVDPYGRHQRFFYNAAIWGVGQRVWVERLEKRQSYPSRMPAEPGPVFAAASPTILSRGQLTSPSEVVGETLVRLRRQLSARLD